MHPKKHVSATQQGLSRRHFLSASACAAAGLALARVPVGAAEASKDARKAPSSPVTVLRCESYEPKVFTAALEKSFDMLGGIDSLVRNKTVTVKLNLTGLSWNPVFGLPAQETYQTQPNTVSALCSLLVKAGAKKVVLIENLYWDKPFEQVLIEAGWDVKAIESAGDHRVSFEDTRNRGKFPGYARFKVPWGGYIYPAFDLNQRFDQTDVLISLAKLKQHATAGITAAVKNCFGNTPTAIYGDTSPDERGLNHRAGMFHGGNKTVPSGVPAEINHGFAKSATTRVPYITADIFGARPTDLNIVDGIRTIRGGEGHWNRGIGLMEPKLLVTGKNGVCTDAVCTALMGFDPQAGEGEFPFQGVNHLALLAKGGIGTNDLSQIEVRGVPIKDAVCPFRV